MDRVADSAGMITGQAWVNLLRVFGRMTSSHLMEPDEKNGPGNAASDARTLIKRNLDADDTAGASAVLEKNRLGLPNFSRMIENAEPAEAVKLYAAGNEQDRKDSDSALRDHILNSTKLEPDEKRALLDKVGMDAPPTLEIDAEVAKLRKGKAAMERADRDSLEMLRQASVATRAGDTARATELRQQAFKLRRDNTQTHADASRLQRLEQIHTSIKNIRKQIDDEIITKDVGDKRIANLLKMALGGYRRTNESKSFGRSEGL